MDRQTVAVVVAALASFATTASVLVVLPLALVHGWSVMLPVICTAASVMVLIVAGLVAVRSGPPER